MCAVYPCAIRGRRTAAERGRGQACNDDGEKSQASGEKVRGKQWHRPPHRVGGENFAAAFFPRRIFHIFNYISSRSRLRRQTGISLQFSFRFVRSPNCGTFICLNAIRHTFYTLDVFERCSSDAYVYGNAACVAKACATFRGNDVRFNVFRACYCCY